MNDFWEWMEQKGYGEREYIGKPTKQMLIGYMMEYLREFHGQIILNTGGRATINDVYDRYVKDLEKVERDHLLSRMTGHEK